MLMDEPFGAIDPIARSRLQDEFLRLQQQLRKTIVFVTHDIDEAIKIGDRIAVMKKGGVLAQYATPAELLLHPQGEFVEQFVGGDRTLKRLSLLRVADVALDPAPSGVGDDLPRLRATASARNALSILLEHERLVVVDEHGVPLGTLTLEAIHATVRREAASPTAS
jgi:osmoprotectant transport system ATP-binding protein